MSESKPQRIRKLFSDPNFGLIGRAAFQKKLRTKGIFISSKELNEILDTVDSSQLFLRPKKQEYNAITETDVGDGYQADLLSFESLGSRNKNFNWILSCVDIYSRRAWAIPVKTKSGTSVSGGLKTIFKDGIPKRLTTDNGKEFLNSSVQALLKKHKIQHYLNEPGSHEILGIIERFNRTLRQRINRNFERIGKLRWIDDISSLVDNYNNTFHTGFKAIPMDVWNRKDDNNQKVKRYAMTLPSGTKVRLLNKSGIFDKGTNAKWSSTIYEIVEREGFKYVAKNIKNGNLLKSRYRKKEVLPVSEKVYQKQVEKNKAEEKGKVEKSRENSKNRKQQRGLYENRS